MLGSIKVSDRSLVILTFFSKTKQLKLTSAALARMSLIHHVRNSWIDGKNCAKAVDPPLNADLSRLCLSCWRDDDVGHVDDDDPSCAKTTMKLKSRDLCVICCCLCVSSVVVPWRHSHDNTICRVAPSATAVYSNRHDRRVDTDRSRSFCQPVRNDDHRRQCISVRWWPC